MSEGGGGGGTVQLDMPQPTFCQPPALSQPQPGPAAGSLDSPAAS